MKGFNILMCGITGFFCQEGIDIYREAIQLSNDAAGHRGPDGAGFAFFSTNDKSEPRIFRTEKIPDDQSLKGVKLAIAHRRLAIIDLSSAGSQPMGTKDRMCWLVYNGEIYNYIELRAELVTAGHVFETQSDTEVILHAYQEWGEDCVNRFNGIWAFALVDLEKQKIFCSRDRFGVKPFHYFYDKEHFVFGSEIKQLLVYPFVPRKMNERAIYEYLAFSAVDYCEETFFDGIHKLLQGENLIFDLREPRLTKNRYYRPTFMINHGISLDEAATKFRQLFMDSVRLQLRSDVAVGSCLSGGLDSSSIVCIIHGLHGAQGQTGAQHTFSSHYDDKDADELEYMEEVINATGVKAHFTYPTGDDLLQDMEQMVWHQEEPFGSTSIFSQWSVFKLIHQNGIKVVLDGQGSDEMLGGYISLATYLFKELFDKKLFLRLAWETWRHRQLHKQAQLPFLGGYWKGLTHMLPGFRRRTAPPTPDRWITPDFEGTYADQSIYLNNQKLTAFGHLDHFNNTLYQLTFLNNLQALLRHEDRNSMAFSVEARVPFLDHRLVELVFSLPADLKIHSGYTKRVMREGMKGILPEKIRTRVSKLGFAAPERAWLKSVLRPLIFDALRDDNLKPFLIPQKAEEYYEYIERGNLIDSTPWRWLNLSLWMKTFNLS